MIVEPVGELSQDEAILLAAELPGLRRLINGDAPSLNAGSAKKLAQAVLSAARGYPALLIAAERLAADPAGLLGAVLAAERIWARPDGEGGTSGAAGLTDGAGYLEVLAAWTVSADGAG